VGFNGLCVRVGGSWFKVGCCVQKVTVESGGELRKQGAGRLCDVKQLEVACGRSTREGWKGQGEKKTKKR